MTESLLLAITKNNMVILAGGLTPTQINNNLTSSFFLVWIKGALLERCVGLENWIILNN